MEHPTVLRSFVTIVVYPANRIHLWKHLLSFRSFQGYRYNIMAVRTLQLDFIALPPGEIAAELECLETGENIMIEKSAQAARIVTTDLECFPNLMAGTAVPLCSGNRCHYFLTDFWILSHFILRVKVKNKFPALFDRSSFKTSDHAQEQGADRLKSAAYMGVCEHFETVRNTVIGCQMGF